MTDTRDVASATAEGSVALADHADRTGSVRGVTVQLAHRALLGTIRIPATIIPIVAMPVFFVLAFGGSFGALTDIPGFPTDNILNWMVPFAILQGAAFAGLGAAFGAGRDLENGFYDRLLLAPTRRISLASGPLLYRRGPFALPRGRGAAGRLPRWSPHLGGDPGPRHPAGRRGRCWPSPRASGGSASPTGPRRRGRAR
ncbi:MAG: hypothetical protein U5R31_02160 [Acidimicrobiia bacterium]|nr:hypothetical protein [Acidimicrobiia bacterium]